MYNLDNEAVIVFYTKVTFKTGHRTLSRYGIVYFICTDSLNELDA
jgi:hypothetical protein